MFNQPLGRQRWMLAQNWASPCGTPTRRCTRRSPTSCTARKGTLEMIASENLCPNLGDAGAGQRAHQ